ncbi:porin [Vibrio mytili]|uniref:Porin n=1 Tax=Vibrio mytili TaxID=50718 RepID=A0A0C3IB53_9VIBR|nr:porin [Vibrio mytili]KIN11532.1 porin [Vibrio mytili]
MKKTLLALAVATVSTSALAAGNIYDDGTTAFNVKGEIDTYVSTAESTTTAAGVKTKNTSDLDVDLWAKIQIDATHKLNDSVTAFGSFEIQNGNGFDGWKGIVADDNSMQTDDLYFGFNIGDNFGIAAGEIGDFGDSLDAITLDNTNEGLGYMDDFVSSLESAGHAISMKYTTGGLKLIGDAYFSSKEDEDVAYGVSAEYAFNDAFKLGATYQDQGNRGLGDDHQIMGAKAGLTLGNFGAAVNYVFENIDGASDLDTISAALDYKLDKARLYTSFGFTDGDNDEEINYYTVGADYAVSSNLLAFTEYTNAEDKADNSNKVEGDGFVAGMYYTF